MDAEIQKVSLSYEVDNTEPSLSVYNIGATYVTSYVNPSFNASFNAPTFEIVYTAATYDVTYVNLTPTAIEAGIFLLKQALADRIYTADQTVFYSSKNLLSNISTIEDSIAIQVAFNRAVSDFVVSQDKAILGLSTTIFDNGYVFESSIKLIGKGTNDSVFLVDSGSLYGQNYVDTPFYFAEDYVGYSTTF